MTIVNSENLVVQPWGRSGSSLLLEDELHALRPLGLALVSSLVMRCWCFRGINLSVPKGNYLTYMDSTNSVPESVSWRRHCGWSDGKSSAG